MKTLMLLIALAAGAFGAESAAKDPIVGKWRWFDGRVIEFRMDNRMDTVKAVKKVAAKDGTWEFQPGTSVERKYKLNWGGGLFINSLTMAKDGKSMKGENDVGVKISADKIE